MENKKSYYAVIPADVRYDQNLTPNAKLLYGEITALCNEKGYCWASNDYFASLYGVSKVSIQKWLKTLEDNGYISRTVKRKEGSKEIEARYITLVSGGHQEKLATPHQEKLAENNTVSNNTINNTNNKENIVECEKMTYQNMVDLFNNICVSLPKVQKITDSRKRKIKARYKSYTPDIFEKLFTMAEQSDFLSGKNGKWTNCNFDWLLNENNMVKVLEGNYNRNEDEPRKNTERPRTKSLNEQILDELKRQGKEV